MKVKHQNADDLLDYLLTQNHVSIRDVYYCAQQREDEIINIMNIFDLETEREQRLALTILGLLAGEQWGGEVTDFYCRDYAITKNYKDNVTMEDVKLLLTACLYHPIFFSFTMRLCKDIKTDLRHRHRTERPKFPVKWNKTATSVKEFILLRAAATTKNTGYLPFNNDPVETPPEVQHGGTLKVEYKKHEEGLYDLRFIFSFNESFKEPPYLPEIEFLPFGKSEKCRFKMEEFHENISSLVYYLKNVELSDESKFTLILNQE